LARNCLTHSDTEGSSENTGCYLCGPLSRAHFYIAVFGNGSFSILVQRYVVSIGSLAGGCEIALRSQVYRPGHGATCCPLLCIHPREARAWAVPCLMDSAQRAYTAGLVLCALVCTTTIAAPLHSTVGGVGDQCSLPNAVPSSPDRSQVRHENTHHHSVLLS